MSLIIVSHKHPSKSRGGIQNYLRHFCDFAASKGIEIGVFAGDSFRGLFKGNRRVPITASAYMFLLRRRSETLFLHGFCCLYVDLCALIGRLLRAPIVWMPHWHPFETHKNPLFSKLYFYTFGRWAYSGNVKIMCLSHHEQQWFSRKFPRAECVLISHGVKKQLVEYPVAKKKEIVIYVGRLAPNKGIDRFISLADALAHLNYRWVVVTPDMAQLQFYDLSNIDILTELSDSELVETIAEAKWCVIPSRYEAFSLVLLESLSLGTPVICSTAVQGSSHFIGEAFCVRIDETEWDLQARRIVERALNIKEGEFQSVSQHARNVLLEYEHSNIFSKHLHAVTGWTQ